MILRLLVITYLIIFFSFISSCAYKYDSDLKTDNQSFENINLNVNSLIINKNLNLAQANSIIIEEINKKLLIKFENWVYKKFKVRGSENTANVNLLEANTVLKEQKNKKTISSLLFDKKEFIYRIKLKFDLAFVNKEGKTKKLKIDSTIKLRIFSNFSVNDKNQIIQDTLERLVVRVDGKVNEQLKNSFFADVIAKN